MQVTQLKNEALKREYSITVPAEAMEKKYNARLLAVGKKAKLPGFRPGKIPLNILKKNYGPSVSQEILEDEVQESSSKAMQNEGLRPAMRPKIELISFGEGKDLEYKMELEVFPEVPNADFSDITIEKWQTDITEKDIDESLAKITERTKNFETVERAAQLGDAVLIDFKGMVNDVAFPGGTSQDFRLELGSGQFIPGFEDQLVGTKAGDDVKVNVVFPTEYHSKDLAGKDAVFEVKVHEVQAASAKEINEDMAKEFGFEDLDKLRGAIKQQLEREYGAFTRNRMKKELFDVLDERFDFAVPEGMVEAEFNVIWPEVESSRKADPQAYESKSEEELKEEYRTMAIRRVRLGILLADVGGKENIQVAQNEITQAVMAQARQFPGEERKVFEYYQKNPGAMEQLKGPILEEKVVDLILSKVTLNEKKVPIADWNEQSFPEEQHTHSHHTHDHGGHVHGPDCEH